MSIFPTFSSLPDQATWEEQRVDSTLRTQTDGGYVLTRPRHTRPPLRMFRFGYTYLSNADKLAFEAFLETVQIGGDAFTWQHPFNGNTYQVRFNSAPVFKYLVFHKNLDGTPDHRWQVTGIDLQEA